MKRKPAHKMMPSKCDTAATWNTETRRFASSCRTNVDFKSAEFSKRCGILQLNKFGNAKCFSTPQKKLLQAKQYFDTLSEDAFMFTMWYLMETTQGRTDGRRHHDQSTFEPWRCYKAYAAATAVAEAKFRVPLEDWVPFNPSNSGAAAGLGCC